jgi:alpha-1,3-rhamnosyl/mannosyltransferase
MATIKLCGSCVRRVFTVSNYSAGKIKIFFSNIRANNICVTYQGVGESFLEVQNKEIGALKIGHGVLNNVERYFLAIGASEPRKNMYGLLSSYSKFLEKRSGCGEVVKLVVSGLDNKAYRECLDECRRLDIERYVIFFKFIDQHDLIYLYRNAVALVFISTEEGFGIPLLEAFSTNCPVICSNSSSMPEVVGHAALLVNPLDSAAVAEAMISVLRKDISSRLIHNGTCRVKEFDWGRVAHRFLEGLK